VDRAKTGSKIHVLSDAEGIPLVVGVSGANLHDSQALIPMIVGIPAVRSRRGQPTKLRADKAYDSAEHRTWLRQHAITPRIARRGIDTGERLGRYRWKSNAPWPGSPDTTGSPCATKSTATTSAHSSPSPPHSSASRN